MQWILVVLISLCWCEVNAIKGLNESECRNNMHKNWFDERYKSYKLSEEEKAYLQGSGFKERADAPPGMRQECRTLSDEKRGRLFRCFRWLFTNRVVPNGLTRYQIFMSQHRFTQAPGAHFGPCFPPWHREYILRLEQALQECDRSLNLCYWDSSLDSSLPDAAHSALWTAEYYGNGQGYVTTGFAANLQSFPNDCASNWPRLFRSIGGNSLLFNRNKIASTVLLHTSYIDLVTPYTSNEFENYHGGVHGFVGGHMSLISCSVTDPVFFFLHTYIDYLFQLFRRRQTTNSQEYPMDEQVPAFHRANDPMLPFTIRCIDGLGDNYIPGLYDYVTSPGACSTHAECGGKALWCNNGRCMACVGRNGRMGATWPNAACYITNCTTPRNVNQVCRCGP